ncbi:hypothetical protein [Chakrabartyella piscis]|uniref:hypothetical protein n=1 Tax=Chakrabartyella piscis TaxID=2918914 RepID=UPI0029585FCC|nr:hypothetical protein [Chakrabartyella piscis]
MKEMDETIEETIEETNVVEDAVDNKEIAVDNPVEEAPESVDNTETKEMEIAETEEMVEIAEISVENHEETVDNQLEEVEETVDNPMETDVLSENPVESVEESVESVDNLDETEELEEELGEPKKKSPWKAIVAVILVAILGFVAYSFLGGSAETKSVLYVKDGGLYVANGEGESTLLHETMGEEAGYHYYYAAWGALAPEDGTMGYYLADVDEIGMGTLYMQDLVKSEDGVAIADDVLALAVSDDGDICLYLTLEDESSVSVYVAKDGVSQLLTDKLLMATTAYALSQDGSYAMFQEDDGTVISLHVFDVATGEITTLAEESVMYVIADDGTGYYIGKEDGINVLYAYTAETGATKIAENVYFFDVMSEDGSALYGVLPTEDITYADLILDDVDDLSAFDAERQAQILDMREQMEVAEGFEPVLQNPYIWKNGESIAIDKDIISLAPITGDGNYFFGYAVPEFEKMPLSEIYSLDEAIMMYYTDLNYGEKELFVANDAGDVYTLDMENTLPSAMMISGDGATIGYLLATETGNRLMVETLGVEGSAQEVALDVQIFGFVGENHTLVYYNNYTNGIGDICVYADGTSTVVDSNAMGVSYAVNEENVLYIANPQETGNGELKEFDGTTATLIAEDVFTFQSRDESSTVYMQGYDMASGVGDIYHYFAGETILIAEDATAIYMY